MRYCYNNQTGSIILSIHYVMIHKTVWRSVLLKVLATLSVTTLTLSEERKLRVFENEIA